VNRISGRPRNGKLSSAHQRSRKLLSILDRHGCFSFRSALASICRIRSRVTENCWPTSSSVWSLFMPRPKRIRTMRSSRGVSDTSTRVVVSRRFDWIAASIGRIAFWSSIRSPRWESPSCKLLAIGLGIQSLSFQYLWFLGQSKRLQMRALFASGDSLSLIFGHRFSSIPRGLFPSETLFCPLSGLIWCHNEMNLSRVTTMSQRHCALCGVDRLLMSVRR
jgi:hypothetical protein